MLPTRIVPILALVASLMLCSCGSDTIDYVPTSGQVEYEIHYCRELKNNGMMGSLLPRKVVSRYNPDGICINIESMLGMCRLRLVTSVRESFAAIEIESQKYIVPLASVTETDEAQTAMDSVQIFRDDTIVDVSGWPSKNICSSQKTPYGELRVSAYYVPVDNGGKQLSDLQGFEVPGMVTAMNISLDEYNVMLSLTGLKDVEVSSTEFARPSGFTQKSAAELMEIISSLMQ